MEKYYYGNMKSRIVIVQLVGDHDFSLLEKERSLIEFLSGGEEFLLAAVKVDCWNDDLTPWMAPPVYREEGFGGKAERTLAYLESEVTAPLKEADPDRIFYIGGYSLAGLFSLWAVSRTDLFAGAAAASPSVWFPEFTDYIMQNAIKADRIYLSLGDREEKTKNVIMAQVGSEIRKIYEHLYDCNVSCTLEWNQGNHFKEPDLRMAKGFAWLLKREDGKENSK